MVGKRRLLRRNTSFWHLAPALSCQLFIPKELDAHGFRIMFVKIFDSSARHKNGLCNQRL